MTEHSLLWQWNLDYMVWQCQVTAQRGSYEDVMVLNKYSSGFSQNKWKLEMLGRCWETCHLAGFPAAILLCHSESCICCLFVLELWGLSLTVKCAAIILKAGTMALRHQVGGKRRYISFERHDSERENSEYKRVFRRN